MSYLIIKIEIKSPVKMVFIIASLSVSYLELLASSVFYEVPKSWYPLCNIGQSSEADSDKGYSVRPTQWLA